MPRLSNALPKYRKHKASGQAICTVGGLESALAIAHDHTRFDVLREHLSIFKRVVPKSLTSFRRADFRDLGLSGLRAVRDLTDWGASGDAKRSNDFDRNQSSSNIEVAKGKIKPTPSTLAIVRGIQNGMDNNQLSEEFHISIGNARKIRSYLNGNRYEI